MAAMATYRIWTGGPVVTKEFGTVAAAKKYVADRAPLKQGWTGAWVRLGPAVWQYQRSNSRGRLLTNMNITLNRTAR